MEEIFKDIPGYEGRYQVSNLGNVRSMRTMKIRQPCPHTKGYLKTDLRKDGKREMAFIHRLVALTFIPNPDNLPEVNHKDGDKTNNRVENLEWVTTQQNAIHNRQLRKGV